MEPLKSSQAALLRFLVLGRPGSCTPSSASLSLSFDAALVALSWRSCAGVSVRPHWKHLIVRAYQSRSSNRSPPHRGQAFSHTICLLLSATRSVLFRKSARLNKLTQTVTGSTTWSGRIASRCFDGSRCCPAVRVPLDTIMIARIGRFDKQVGPCSFFRKCISSFPPF